MHFVVGDHAFISSEELISSYFVWIPDVHHCLQVRIHNLLVVVVTGPFIKILLHNHSINIK
jgi:hypothetical protein